MNQHPIDLLPLAIRDRSQAGVRTGRYVAAAVVSILLLLMATLHARLGLQSARAELVAKRVQADAVLATEGKAVELRHSIEEIETYVDRYREIAVPVPVSHILATAINSMPASMSLDRIDVDAAARTAVRSARTAVLGSDAAAPRVLVVEIAGFAPNDAVIAEYDARLTKTGFCRQVSLDFSRTRSVRGHQAREFRLSFRIDLDAVYEIETPDAAKESDSDA